MTQHLPPPPRKAAPALPARLARIDARDLVSVIVPVHDGARVLERCLRAILSQSHVALEVFVIDDGSRDGAPARIVKSLDDPRLSLVRLDRRSGAARARNAGLKRAQGRYIAFCDCDDVWAPGKIAAQIALLEQTGEALCHTSVHYVSDASRRLRPARPRVTYDDMRVRNWIANSSGLFDADAVGPVRQERHAHEDYAMWCTLLRDGAVSVGVPEPLVEIHRSRGSLSGNKWRSLAWHVVAQRRIFGMDRREIALRLAQNAATRLRAALGGGHGGA